MNPKRWSLVACAGLFAAAGLWFFSTQDRPQQPQKTPSLREAKIREAPTLPPISFPNAVDHPVLESSVHFQTSESNGEQDLEIIGVVLDCFRQHFGGNPVGENEEIFAALRGKNPKGIHFLPDSFPGLQSDEKVHDRWGTPWHFHAISGQQMEVLSAGPDRMFGTEDDFGSNAQN
jgi:hypothetical protein